MNFRLFWPYFKSCLRPGPNSLRHDIFMFLIFYLLNIFDMISTVYAISKGYAFEANPIMRALMSCGMGWFIAAKIIVPIPISFVMLFFPFMKRWNPMITFIAGMYTMLALTHVMLYLNHG